MSGKEVTSLASNWPSEWFDSISSIKSSKFCNREEEVKELIVFNLVWDGEDKDEQDGERLVPEEQGKAWAIATNFKLDE